jgi:OOP family OmpA-OmpF porin
MKWRVRTQRHDAKLPEAQLKPLVLLKLAPMLLLAACATYNLQELERTEPQGSAFNQALAREYLTFAQYEANKMYDWIDQDHFARKGLRAAAGEVVEPEQVADWGVPESQVGEIDDARARLMAAFAKGGREAAPQRAAVAQARFDCWVEQWEEGWQKDHIAACRDEMMAALQDVETAMAPKPAPRAATPPPPPPAPAPEAQTSLVFFDFNSAVLTPEARAIVRTAATNARRGTPTRIEVTGHADKSGPDAYNLRLSQRRAEAVQALLVSEGVGASNIGVAAKGEADPLVPTPDGVREPQNRRVEIVIRR